MKHGRKEHDSRLLGFQLHRVTSGGRGLHNGGKSCSWWRRWATDRAAAFASLVSRVFEPPCREFRLLPFFLPWLQMLPRNPWAKNKQKNPEALKLWLLNSIDEKKRKKETNKTKNYLFCHKAWNFTVLQVWQNYRWEIELKREKRGYSKVCILFKRESLWPTGPGFLTSMKELLN